MDFLPGAVQVLIEWFMLLISTLIGYFHIKDMEDYPVEDSSADE